MSRIDGVSTPERAFELARTGTCRTVADIRRHLNLEGFVSVDAHLAGRSIKAQLNKLLADRKPQIDV